MTRRVVGLLCLVGLLLAAGCARKPKLSQLTGTVTFRGQPVPAGWIAFTPDVDNGGRGAIKLLKVLDGNYDSSKEEDPGLAAGAYLVRIAGFDGKKITGFNQGKQIFNPVDDTFTVPEGKSTKDFVVPESAGQNVKISRTSDEPG